MAALIIFTLILGIILGLSLAVATSLWIIQVNCPKCKQLKPLWQIILFQWKKRVITGQPCLKCQRPKPQIEIDIY